MNYRTSQQIRCQADRLLPILVGDVDGIAEDRRRVISVFDGRDPEIAVVEDQDTVARMVGQWIAGLRQSGMAPNEIAVFVRDIRQIDRARKAVDAGGEVATLLDDHQADASTVSVATMHRAKGLEFRAVAVIACDDDVLPDLHRLEAVVDEADLEEVSNTERHLLYVACTRTRDALLITGVDPVSEFIDDLDIA